MLCVHCSDSGDLGNDLAGGSSDECSVSESDSEGEEEGEEYSAAVLRPSLSVGGGFRWEVGQEGGDSETLVTHTNSSDSDSEEIDDTEEV